MLNPKELRIGNFLIAKQGICVVVGIHKDGYTLIKYSDYYPYQDDKENKDISVNVNDPFSEPIPIGEKWLLSFGFEERADLVWVHPDILWVEIKKKNNWNPDFFCNASCGDKVISEPQYVHQLQNLFYALTGEELKIQVKED